MNELHEAAKAAGIVIPETTVTLKVADEGDRVIYVAELPGEVLNLVNEAATPLITLTRVRAMKATPFHTRPDNVANVEKAS